VAQGGRHGDIEQAGARMTREELIHKIKEIHVATETIAWLPADAIDATIESILQADDIRLQVRCVPDHACEFDCSACHGTGWVTSEGK
jgi:hypothetical protein